MTLRYFTLDHLDTDDREFYVAVLDALKASGIEAAFHGEPYDPWKAARGWVEIPLWPIGPLGDLDDRHSPEWERRGTDLLERVRGIVGPLVPEWAWRGLDEVVTIERGGDPVWELRDSRPGLYKIHTCNCGTCGTFVISPLEAYIHIEL